VIVRLRVVWVRLAVVGVLLAVFPFRMAVRGQEATVDLIALQPQVNSSAPVGQAGGSWSFAASGDSRNCGDVVMPAIADGAARAGASFYWHLGDFRAIYNFDEDIQHQPAYLAKPLNILGYEEIAWEDFIESQLKPFGILPIYLTMGNHEAIPPKTREDYLIQFADWLETPRLREQRLSDDPRDFRLHSYYHWIERGVDFITLDNATPDQFDRAQITWLEKTLKADSSNPDVHTVVAGMHKPLPESISTDHSMNESAAGIESGHRAYADLLKLQNDAHKRVYVLASHSHYYMEGIFNTDYWRSHGGVLPGWIVGTAGAQRYPLPKNSSSASEAQMDVYGFLLGTVKPNGETQFTFQRLGESDVPATVVDRYTQQFVHWCFAENSVAH
jgi:calcineurin-like phosphoesterase family protein